MRIQKTIAEFVDERALVKVAPGDSVAVAMDRMRSENADCVLVCSGTELVGIFTQRDFLNRVIGAGRLPADITVGDVMSHNPVTLCADDCVTYAINRMALGGYRNIPIVSSEGRLLSNLNVHAVVRHLSDVCAELKEDPEAANMWTDLGGAG